MASKELEKKFQGTAAYRNLKDMLNKKNALIKDLRKKIAKYVYFMLNCITFALLIFKT